MSSWTPTNQPAISVPLSKCRARAWLRWTRTSTCCTPFVSKTIQILLIEEPNILNLTSFFKNNYGSNTYIIKWKIDFKINLVILYYLAKFRVVLTHRKNELFLFFTEILIFFTTIHLFERDWKKISVACLLADHCQSQTQLIYAWSLSC
jgi:hypothetical protein